MTQNHKAWMILAVVALLVTLYWTRYQAIETSGGTTCYRINRLTGAMIYIHLNLEYPTFPSSQLSNKTGDVFDKISKNRISIANSAIKKGGGDVVVEFPDDTTEPEMERFMKKHFPQTSSPK